MQETYGGPGEIKSILKEADVTGDGVPEALVDLGSAGTTSDWVALVNVEHACPARSRFKMKSDGIDTPVFKTGDGGAGRYASTVELVPEKHAVYIKDYVLYGKSNTVDNTDHCLVDTYVWNTSTSMFEWDATLGKEVTKSYCKQITDELRASHPEFF